MKFFAYLWNVLFPSPLVDRSVTVRPAIRVASANNRAASENLVATIGEVLEHTERVRAKGG